MSRKKIAKPGPDIIKKLIAYSWPGNVRELQNVLKSSMVIGNWEEIVDDLYSKNRSVALSGPTDSSPNNASIVDVFLDFKSEYSSGHASFSLKKIKKKALDRIEKEVISFVLDKTGWNRTKASSVLKVSYKTLLYKISDLNIKPPSDKTG